MKQRTITGLVLALILIPAFVLGGVFVNIVLMLMTLGASYELQKMFNKNHELPSYLMAVFIILSGVLYFTIQSYYDVTFAFKLEWAFLMMIFIVVLGSVLLVIVPQYSASHFGNSLISVLYPALGFGALYGIRESGIYQLGFLFLITIATDIFAYFVGVRFGKHRLAVHISPKKSVEGSVGGTICALLLTLLYLYIFDVDHIGYMRINIFTSILLIVFISFIGQIGDLIASRMKRDFEIKDFSNLFPGHGGVLDRFDSVVFAAMVLMLLSEFVGILS